MFKSVHDSLISWSPCEVAPENCETVTFREWQRQAFMRLKDEPYRAVSAATGSGKSILARGYGIHDFLEGRKVLIVVPNNILKRGSYGELVLQLPNGETYTWTGRVTVLDSVQAVLDFMAQPWTDCMDEGILVTTHSALRQAQQHPDWRVEGTVSLIFDECHFAKGGSNATTCPDPEDSNVIGGVVDYWVREEVGPVTMLSATWFRGDCHQIVQRDLLRGFKRFTLPIYEYIEQYGGPSTFRMRYVFGETPDVLEGLYQEKPNRVTILFQKHGGPSHDKYEAVGRVFETFGPFEREGYCQRHTYQGRPFRTVDLVTDLNIRARDDIQDGLVDAVERKEYPDLVAAIDLGKQGLNIPPCDTLILEGQRTSFMDILQRIGRATRAFPGKDEIDVVFVLPEPPGNAKERVQSHLKMFLASLVIEALFRPPCWHTRKTGEDSEDEGEDEDEDFSHVPPEYLEQAKGLEYVREDPERLKAILDRVTQLLLIPGTDPNSALMVAVREVMEEDPPSWGGQTPSPEGVQAAIEDLARVHLGASSGDITADVPLGEGFTGLVAHFLSVLQVSDLKQIRTANRCLDIEVLKEAATNWREREAPGHYFEPSGMPGRPMAHALRQGLVYKAFQKANPEFPVYSKLKSLYGASLTQNEIFGYGLDGP
jgi:hypothetical protein